MRTIGASLMLLLAFPLFAGKPSRTAPSCTTGFIVNKGQIVDQHGRPNPGVLYLFNGDGLNVQLRKGGFSYDVWKQVPDTMQARPAEASTDDRMPDAEAIARSSHRIDIDFLGASPGCRVEAGTPSEDYFNYYTGPEGITLVHHYHTVTYHGLYPHIDVVFRILMDDGSPRMKYDLIVRPGGDPSNVRMRYAGASMELAPRGPLRLDTPLGTLHEHLPESWHLQGGRRSNTHVHVERIEQDVLGFRYDAKQALPPDATLVIDPVPSITWATFYGGIGSDRFNNADMAVDGSLYACGNTSSLNWIATSGAHSAFYSGTPSAMLVKFSTGGARQWATYYGSQGTTGVDVAVGTANNVFLCGHAGSASGIAGANAPGVVHQYAGAGSAEGYLAQFTSSGFRIWGTYFGGPGWDTMRALTCDSAGDPILVGHTCSTTGIATPGAPEGSYMGPGCFSNSDNGFLVKFSANGPRLWGTYVGTGGFTEVRGVSTDGTSIFIAGSTGSPVNIATPGAHLATQPSANWNWDGFLMKYDGTGAKLWGTYYGGGYKDDVNDCLAEPGTGMVYLCGTTASPDGIATPGTHQPFNLSPVFSTDAFLAKFNGSGTRQWGTYLGGNDSDRGEGLSIGLSGRIYLSGFTWSSQGIATYDTPVPTLPYTATAYLARFNAAGQRAWGTYCEGSWVGAIRCAARGNVVAVLSGTYDGVIPITPGAHQSEFGGTMDGYLVRYYDRSMFHPWPPLMGMEGASITARSLDDRTIEVKALPDAAVAEGGRVTISDAQGRVVQEQHWPDLREPLVLDLPDHGRGVLLVRVVTGTRSSGTRVLSWP